MLESTSARIANSEVWPSLDLDAWEDTYKTLHMWTQIVGKIRQRHCPPVNHWWHVTLYVSSRGLTTGPMYYGNRSFEIEFDFLDSELVISTSDGDRRALPLAPMPVAGFYRQLTAALRELSIDIQIPTMPQEVPDPIPFDKDFQHASYDPEYARRCWRILAQTDRVCRQFRSGFIGKVSPVHFFWGAFDLAVTRFSGRRAPEHPAAGGLSARVTQEAYSHEVYSCGWWPGGGIFRQAAFYAYAYPEPVEFKEASVGPTGAVYAAELGEFILPYESVRTAADPDASLLAFFKSTYAAAANLGGWDRAALEGDVER